MREGKKELRKNDTERETPISNKRKKTNNIKEKKGKEKEERKLRKKAEEGRNTRKGIETTKAITGSKKKNEEEGQY